MRRLLYSTKILSNHDAAIFMCSWPSPLFSLHQLASTRYAAHSTWCHAGSPQWFTRLPSHRRSCCGVRGPIRRADVYQTGGNKPRDWRAYRPTLDKSSSGSSRSVFVLTLQGQWTNKAATCGNWNEMIGSGLWQSSGSIHIHWHTSLNHSTTSWTDKWSLKRSPEARCEDQGKSVCDLETAFVHPSLIEEYGCIRIGS